MLLAEQSTLNLAMGLHCHQPVGNWHEVIERAYLQAYEPILAALEAHPGVRFTLHYSGHLLDWILANHPEFVTRLRALLDRGQIELLTGAHYEPILAILPDADKVGQIRKQTATLERAMGIRPQGMWLTERVWEPHLVKPIAEAGVRYVMLDDHQFLASGLRSSELYGYYLTEDQGQTLELFPLNQRLRQLTLFNPPARLLDSLREMASPDGSRLVLCFDDAERWGTHLDWVEKCFALLEQNQDWARSTTIGQYRREHQPWGRIYVPALAYPDMQEWALPPDQALAFANARREIPEKHQEFLRGGFFRNFLVRYPEANGLHKKMLLVSDKVAELAPLVSHGEPLRTPDLVAVGGPADASGARLASEPPDLLWARAQDTLWKSQANEPYWHGRTGGIYLSHLRSASYRHLLEAESICDRLLHADGSFLAVEQRDFDADGAPEVLVSSASQNLYFTAQGGALFEADYKSRRFNLLDTLARRPEVYHRRQPTEGSGRARQANAGGQAAAPEMPEFDLAAHERYLHYDWYRHLSLLDHFLHPDTYLESFYNVSYGEQGDFVNQAYTAEVAEFGDRAELVLRRAGHVWVAHEFWPVTVEKRVTIPREGAAFSARYTLSNGWNRPVWLWFGVELNVNLLAGHASDRAYYLPDGRVLEHPAMASKGEVTNLGALGLRDLVQGLDVQLFWDRPTTVWRFPVETVSASETGFERIYQGSVVMPHWRFELPADGRWEVTVSQRVCEI